MSIDMAVFTWLVVLSVDGSGWFLMLMCDIKVCSVISVFVSMIKQGSHLHDLQQEFNKTKTHAVKCEEQVAVLRSEITETLYAIALRMQHDTNLII